MEYPLLVRIVGEQFVILVNLAQQEDLQVVVVRHLFVEVVILKNQVVKTVPVQQDILVNAILVQIHVHNMYQILHVL